MRRPAGSWLVAVAVAISASAAGSPAPAAAHSAAPYKVAIIVGPAGPATPWFLGAAEEVAGVAEDAGATVARAYSPNATPERVLAAVEDAKIILYFGHGNGFPSPYSSSLHPDRVDGWGLQGPAATGTHADQWRDGTLKYYGEEWIVANAHPAPGFVMIYSNSCYTTGAPELWMPPASEGEARQRVENYARPMLLLGASAYFATDFSGSAARLVDAMLADSMATFGDLFAADHRYVASGVSAAPHRQFAAQQVWLQRSADNQGRLDYWYAFAGDPNTSLAGISAWQWPVEDMAWPGLRERMPTEMWAPWPDSPTDAFAEVGTGR